MPPTAYSTPSTLPTVCGTSSSRRVDRAASDASSVPFPASGMSTTATVLSALTSTSIGLLIWPLASAFRSSSAIACRTGADVTSSAWIATCAGSLPPGKAASRCLTGDDLGDRDVVDAGRGRVERQRRRGEGEEDRRRRDDRDDRPAEDTLEDRSPDARVSVLAAEPVHEGDTALLDAIAELREHCGQHGERTDHRDRDDHHRADREGHERLVAGEEHAGHRDQDGDAGDQDGPAGGGRGGLERSALAPPGCTLFALTPEVEERVVDADRQADQEDDFRDRLVDRDELARDARSTRWS